MKGNAIGRQRGFTLVEVLVAMTLLGIMLALLFGAISMSARNQRAAETKMAHSDELRLVGNFVQQLIAHSLPLVWIDRDGRRLIFEGKSDEIRFAALLPAHRGGGGVQLVTLKHHRAGKRRPLELHYRYADPEHPLDGPAPEPERVILLEDVDGVSFSYFGKHGTDSEPAWRDAWQDKERLPGLVSLKLHASSSAQAWPELRIPLRAGHAPGRPELVLRYRGDDRP